MVVQKTYAEINEKIKKGEAVVLTAEEILPLVEEVGIKEAAQKVDVVTTATFGPMCSSGVFINFGHSDPPIRMSKVWLNNVPAYAGIAAVDAYLGATEVAEKNNGQLYGGAHVIEDLLKGRKIELVAKGSGTDCYPKKEIQGYIDLESLNEAILFNPRNAYQNYGAATNSSEQTIFTYMGVLLPRLNNVTYSTSGQLSPLLNDPYLRTIGLGTRIFLGGAQGYVAWQGTQFNTACSREDNGVPNGPGATLSLIGNLKAMSPDFIKAAIYERYGVSMFVGIGVPIPILDEEMLKFVSVKDADIYTSIFDYGVRKRSRPALARVNYQQLKSGQIEINGKKVKTAPLSSMAKARQIAQTLKEWIVKGEFLIQEPVHIFPQNNSVKALTLQEVDLSE